MKYLMKLILVMMAMGTLAGCAGMSQDQTIGTLTGGALGGLAGSQIGQGNGRTVALLGGAALGAMAGNSVGLSMDKANNP